VDAPGENVAKNFQFIICFMELSLIQFRRLEFIEQII
jgi:hypothetical protein